MLNTVIRLRRDNDYNYAKIKDRFVPANGEICLVDTATTGLRAVCGDGKTPFGELEFMDECIKFGYYYNNNFYTDLTYSKQLPAFAHCIYVDKMSSQLFYFNGNEYKRIGSGSVPNANSTTPGIMKLYETIGQNTDGTMTQKAITDELDDKFEIALNIEEETIIFSNDL